LCKRCRSDAPLATESAPTPVIDLPLGATEDRVVGALDIERAPTRGEKAFEPGLLAAAHRGFLYIDRGEPARRSCGRSAARRRRLGREGGGARGAVAAPSGALRAGRVGQPRGGGLRPRLLDRFGLSVEISSPRVLADRVQVLRRRDAYDRDPHAFAAGWTAADAEAGATVTAARARLPDVTIPDDILETAAALCLALGADGLRGEVTLMRVERARAALTGDMQADKSHLRAVAPSALRHRLRRDPLDEAGSSVRVERAGRACDHRGSGRVSEARTIAPVAPAPAPAPAPGIAKAPSAAGEAPTAAGKAHSGGDARARWRDAALGAALLAVDPEGLGGALARARAGPARDAWLTRWRALQQGPAPRRIPLTSRTRSCSAGWI
jgi:magnesium chelatase subunit I